MGKSLIKVKGAILNDVKHESRGYDGKKKSCDLLWFRRWCVLALLQWHIHVHTHTYKHTTGGCSLVSLRRVLRCVFDGAALKHTLVCTWLCVCSQKKETVTHIHINSKNTSFTRSYVIALPAATLFAISPSRMWGSSLFTTQSRMCPTLARPHKNAHIDTCVVPEDNQNAISQPPCREHAKNKKKRRQNYSSAMRHQ